VLYIHIYTVFRKAIGCRETEVDFGEACEKAVEKLESRGLTRVDTNRRLV
jgi:hypothetical protein